MISPAIRQLVRQRAGDRCEYCRQRQDDAQVVVFHVEHVLPRQHGGQNDAGNLAFACPRCNRFKGPNLTGVDPMTGGLVRLFNPRSQSWPEHFQLVGIEILGTTSIGRATAALLQMNESRRLESRAALLERGELDV